MAEGIEAFRNAVAGHAAREIGLRSDQPTSTVGNQRARGSQTDVYAMPVDGGNWLPLQVLATGDVNFGKFYFLPDYDTPDDATKVVR